MSAHQIALVIRALRFVIRLLYANLDGPARVRFKDEYETAIEELRQR